MPTIPYTINADLFAERPQLEDGNISFTPYHIEAADIINRTINTKWYKDNSAQRSMDFRVTPFDPALLSDSGAQVKRLATFQTLKLIYESLITGPDDENIMQMDRFIGRYNDELELVMDEGIDYDWNDDGTIQPDEKAEKPAVRTIVRQ